MADLSQRIEVMYRSDCRGAWTLVALLWIAILFVLIDATHANAVPAATARISGNAAFKPLVVSSGVYTLMWDLAKSDL